MTLQAAVNSVLGALIVALVAVLVAAVKGFGDAAIAYVKRKQDALVAKIGSDTYQSDLAVGRSVWGAVDEYFRITPTVTKTIAAAQAKFAEFIKKRIPGITDDEIEQIRQAVAGEVNKGRAALTAGQAATATPNTPVVETADVNADAVDGTQTGAAQAAEVKQDTAGSSEAVSQPASSESGAVASGTTGAV